MIGERYRVESVLGTGGMGTVYLAEHVLMEKKVALKVLHPTLAVVSSVMERFQHEAVALARIDHPNVVNATDFGKLPNGASYLALQYVEGRDLARVLAQDGALEPLRAARLAYQISRALEAAHSQGIVHRDLKPHNVMLTSTGGEDGEQAKVLDFGLAKLRSKTGEGRAITQGSVFGTPHYISPEQISEADVDGRADLYCLGLILYEMLSGRRAFEGRDVKDVLRRQLAEPAEPLSDDIPEALRELVEQLMQKQVEARPDSAATVASILEQLLAPPRESSVRELLGRNVTISRWSMPVWALVLPAAVFMLIFVIGVVATNDDKPPTTVTEVIVKEKVASSPEPVDVPKADEWLSLISAAEFGEEDAMKRLGDIPPRRRDKEVWLVLGRGYMKTQQTERALDTYAKAVAHIPELRDNEEIATNVRLAAKDSATAVKAVAVAAESLGERGVNILFSTWADTARRTNATALAERYLKQSDVMENASVAVKLALEAREIEDCEHARRLLTKVMAEGDTRALRPLAKMRSVKGCGDHKQDDCWPCLRQDNLLEDAITAAAKRIGPKN